MITRQSGATNVRAATTIALGLIVFTPRGASAARHKHQMMCIKRHNGLCVISVRRVEMEIDGPPGVTRRGRNEKVGGREEQIEISD